MIGRYRFSEITINRLISAFKTRVQEFPHEYSWKFQLTAKNNKESLKKYKNRYIGKRCFIIANGPSIQKTNLELLANEVSFGLNRIYLQFPVTKFRPNFYIAINELILEQFSDEINNLEMPKFLNWNRRIYYGLPNETKMFLKSKMVINDAFQKDVTQPMVFGATVTFVALQLAYYMGFQQAILVGLDHTYIEKGVPSKTEVRTSEQDSSHFHPNYFPKGVKWQLPDLLRSEKEFAIAREVYECDGREILDATISGKCPVFKRIDYSSLF